MTSMPLTTPSIPWKPLGFPGSRRVLSSVAGRRLLRRLGVGGMSEVYLAFDETRMEPVAVKVLADDLSNHPTSIQRFVREGELGKTIDHPNIVRCLESGLDAESGRHYLILEFVKGESAQALLERRGPMDVGFATQLVWDIARALEELHHRGYVHRDVKPGNILVGEDGRGRLADLGVAKKLDDIQDLTSFDVPVGTPFYMPWEQSLNASLVDPRSDLFALGATFYHLVTGRVPFPGRTAAEVARRKELGQFVPAREIEPRLPTALDNILCKLLARLPSERFQSAAQLMDALSASGLAEARRAAARATTVVPQAATRREVGPGRRIRSSSRGARWVYQYRHEAGWKRGRARTADIRQWYAEGLLPDHFFVARVGQRTCRNFRAFPEFRDLKRRPGVRSPSGVPSGRARLGSWSWAVLGLALALALTSAGSLILHHVAQP